MYSGTLTCPIILYSRNGQVFNFPYHVYRSVPLIRPIRKYALPLFYAQVPAQGSLTRYNAPLVSVFWNI